MNLHTQAGGICLRCGQPLGIFQQGGQLRYFSRWTGSQLCPVIDTASLPPNRKDRR